MQWWRDWKPHKWIDVHFALEQFSGPEGNKDGILFIYYNFYEEKKVRKMCVGTICDSFISLCRGKSCFYSVKVSLSQSLYLIV